MSLSAGSTNFEHLLVLEGDPSCEKDRLLSLFQELQSFAHPQLEGIRIREGMVPRHAGFRGYWVQELLILKLAWRCDRKEYKGSMYLKEQFILIISTMP